MLPDSNIGIPRLSTWNTQNIPCKTSSVFGNNIEARTLRLWDCESRHEYPATVWCSSTHLSLVSCFVVDLGTAFSYTRLSDVPKLIDRLLSCNPQQLQNTCPTYTPRVRLFRETHIEKPGRECVMEDVHLFLHTCGSKIHHAPPLPHRCWTPRSNAAEHLGRNKDLLRLQARVIQNV